KFVLKTDRNATAAIASADETRLAVSKGGGGKEDDSTAEDVIKLLTTVTEAGSKIAGQKGLSYREDSTKKDEEERKEEQAEIDKDKKLSQKRQDISKSTIDAGTNILNLILHSVEAYKHKKKGDESKLSNSQNAEYAKGITSMSEVTTDTFDALSNLSDAFGAGFQDAKPAKPITDSISTLFSTVSSGAKIFGNYSSLAAKAYERKASDKIAKSSVFHDSKNKADLKSAKLNIDTLSGIDDRNLDAAQKAYLKKELTANRKARRNAKAKKYAMNQAARLHKAKNSGNFKIETASTVFESLGNLSSIVKGLEKLPLISKFTTNWLGAGGGLGETVFKAIKGGLDIFKKKDEEKSEKRFKDEKKKVVDEYLNKNMKTIKEKSSGWNPNPEEAANLASIDADDENNDNTIGDNEAKRLVLMKLGFYLRTNAQADNISSDEIFKRITEKRANQIMQSNNKDAMLTSLGFADVSKVTFNDVYKVLSGETV
ncbi:MAG: hypothetical protein IKI33_06920, partial [Eubacterium sp.]|nr:hypothetical protein [Eubacterium sp.]